MIPLALIISHFWNNVKNKNIYIYYGLSVTIALIFVLYTGVARPLYMNNTDKYILKTLDNNLPIYSLEQKSYSSQFYTKGRIEVIDQKKFENLVTKDSKFYISISNNRWVSLSLSLRNKLEIINNNKKKGIYQFKN